MASSSVEPLTWVLCRSSSPTSSTLETVIRSPRSHPTIASRSISEGLWADPRRSARKLTAADSGSGCRAKGSTWASQATPTASTTPVSATISSSGAWTSATTGETGTSWRNLLTITRKPKGRSATTSTAAGSMPSSATVITTTAPRSLANLNFVFPTSFANSSGINFSKLDLTAFGAGAAPVDTNQYTFGINYWFYASNVVHFAYEINQEVNHHLNDNIFMAQWAWFW